MAADVVVPSEEILRHPAVDVVVIGAGAVGAACAYFAARAGLSVAVVERGAVASGTSSGGEGNILVSDKDAGPELDLALYSQSVWRNELSEHADRWEFDSKGGLVVAATEAQAQSLKRRAVRQREAGIDAIDVAKDDLRGYEPHLAPDLVAGVYYPQDAQVQPMLVAAHLLRLAREAGAVVHTRVSVTGFLRRGRPQERADVIGVRTTAGDIPSGCVVNAAGTWAGGVAALAGVDVPVLPRRGFVLVTEPLAGRVRHKVYAAGYVDDVESSDAGLQTSPVVEGTESGTILIGSSRERVGFDDTFSVRAISAIAAKAIALFPMLADAKAIRAYHGFRPYCPDHLPVIGPDPRAPGLWHACGHEGAGIGLAAGTGSLVARALTSDPTMPSLADFAPERFGAVA
ncbi:FAD-binding oxidoreductase [Planctomonas sp. JC2975]|uniref:NAD(P)/FAD-dependent oxidoreductase n=1 Tax=Planctomonas sp. JC2975 TaxID=2729626 RepID=UPI00147447D1|nr:FAD-dependent oxidoreductase [Planctomonas sp. JC2975]NNC11267.1 FAD-binding oxidoreductase [Planctomonas sp. JC2975]